MCIVTLHLPKIKVGAKKTSGEMPILWVHNFTTLGKYSQAIGRSLPKRGNDLSISLYRLWKNISRLPTRNKYNGSDRSDALSVRIDLEDGLRSVIPGI